MGSVAAAREEAQATEADYETAKLSLEVELALDYFELRRADVIPNTLHNGLTREKLRVTREKDNSAETFSESI